MNGYFKGKIKTAKPFVLCIIFRAYSGKEPFVSFVFFLDYFVTKTKICDVGVNRLRRCPYQEHVAVQKRLNV